MFDVITIGSATRDIFLKSGLFKVLRDPKHLETVGFPTGEAQCFALGSKITVDSFARTAGGDAANAAVTFARQGLSTAMVVKIGDDESGREIIKELAAEHITFLNKPQKGETDYATILLAPGGERTILLRRGTPIQRKGIPFPKLKAQWAYIAPANIDAAIMRDIFATLKKNGVKIAFNPSGYYIKNYAKDLKAMIAQSDVVIANREEAALFTDVAFHDEKKLFKKFDAMVNGIAIMTDGPRGALASDGHTVYRCSTFKEKGIEERTGAGDAFGSGFVAGFIRSNDICYALRLAAANSTSVIEYVGAQAGILSKKDFEGKRWKFVNLDVEPLY